MYPSHGGPRRPQRFGRRDRSSLARQALRRLLPCLPLLRRLFNMEGPPQRRFCVRVLLMLMLLLLVLLGFLLSHLLLVENATLAAHLHLPTSKNTEARKEIVLPLAGSSAAELRTIEAALKPFTPRLKGPMPRVARNGFVSTYFDLEERALPPLTLRTLQAWSAADNASAAEVAEEVLIQHVEAPQPAPQAGAEAEAFFDLLSFLHPPAMQQGYYRTALSNILRYGTRVGGAHREPLLHHLLHEGLGRRYYDANQCRYNADAAVHLSAAGQTLLEKTMAAWPTSPQLITTAATDAEAPVVGWRWSLLWDNFTVALPAAVRLQPPSSNAAVTLHNLVFQFPGGSQFRRKRAAAPRAEDIYVGRRRHTVAATTAAAGAFDATPADVREGLYEDEYHPLDGVEEVYTQELLIGPGRMPEGHFYVPKVQRGVPGMRAPISVPGSPVPLKPSLSAATAEPVSRQPVQHAVYAAHWDSMLHQNVRFLAACDSAMPMVFLLRTMRNIAVLTDVAEALTESFRAERAGGADAAVPAGVPVPGLTHTFRNATTEAEVRQRLSKLLSPAHHALLYDYFFARPYTSGTAVPGEPAADGVTVDVRMWLDWVQHLPALSLVFFDAEEAFEKWAGNDHTYGSRHLAERWKATKTATQTRYSGGPQSLFASVDLFALYDLMGTAGSTFYNLFPTQSGIYYAALAQKEREQRTAAYHYTRAITSELLWRVLGTPQEAAAAAAKANSTTPSPTVAPAEDAYVRQLGASVDTAIAAIDHRHITRVLSDPASRPSRELLPRQWLLYGAPHEMLTLHRLSLRHFSGVEGGPVSLESARQYDDLKPGVVESQGFNTESYMEGSNINVFFEPSYSAQRRRSLTDPVIQDDHLHWLDTQRVLHLISYPFPRSWHTERDDGREIHDGTSVDLARVLWSAVLELGHYWTGEGDAGV